MRSVFISGATGYLGRTLAETLSDRAHDVFALVRAGSERRAPRGAQIVTGDALDWQTFASRVAPCETFVHLTGVAHPAPWKEREFRAVDLASLRASVRAAQFAGVQHFVYLSVARPAPVMKAYIRVRQECEEILGASGVPATILRPWYVLGPGRRWPVLLKPAYALLEALPATREGARRLGLVTLGQMNGALVWAVEHPATNTRIMDVPTIREAGSA